MFIGPKSTAFGIFSQPHSVEICTYRIRMNRKDSKKVLWENVSKLMVARYSKENLTKLAADAGIGPATCTRIKEQKTSVGTDVLEAVAGALKVLPWHLLVSGLDPNALPSRPAEQHDVKSDFVPVRHADVAFSNGLGVVVYHENDNPPLMFRAEFLRKLNIAAGDAVVVDADGNSNEPKIIDGSVVLVNKGDRDRLDGDFFAFRFEDELLIKRLQHLEGIGILATAENPNFKPKQKVYKNFEPTAFEVIGRALWTGARL